jgi:hypothetical protein
MEVWLMLHGQVELFAQREKKGDVQRCKFLQPNDEIGRPSPAISIMAPQPQGATHGSIISMKAFQTISPVVW